MSTAEDRLRRVRRRWAVAGTAVLVTALATTAVAALAGRSLRSPAQLAADARPVTATVERRVLAEPVVLRGKVQPGASTSVLAPPAAVGPNSVVTKVLAKPGAGLREGQVLLERSGEPLLLLVLPFPAYRDLTAGLKGPDVTEVQKALRRLGKRLTVTGAFDAATQQAVAALYADRGYPAPTQAQPPATDDGATPAPAARTVRLPQAHLLVLPSADHTISGVNVHVGDVLTDPKAALLELDRQAPTILALAGRDSVTRLRPGQAVTASDDAAGTEAKAVVSSVGEQPVTAEGTTGFEVRMTFAGTPLSADGQRSVRLTVQVAAGAEPVLAVPVTAMSSHADGTTFVTVDDNGVTHDVTVTAGQLAGGWVEIRSSTEELAVGTAVVVGVARSTP